MLSLESTLAQSTLEVRMAEITQLPALAPPESIAATFAEQGVVIVDNVLSSE